MGSKDDDSQVWSAVGGLKNTWPIFKTELNLLINGKLDVKNFISLKNLSFGPRN